MAFTLISFPNANWLLPVSQTSLLKLIKIIPNGLFYLPNTESPLHPTPPRKRKMASCCFVGTDLGIGPEEASRACEGVSESSGKEGSRL